MAERRVVLCADDFGLTEGVSRGILDLIERGRLSATGAMTNRPPWPRLAAELRRHHGRVAVGLHLNLTLGRPLGPLPSLAPDGVLPGLGALTRAALAGRLARGEVAAEIERQLDAFEEAFGAAPDFVDGHQHVHVLPGIRGPLLAALARRGARVVWLRDPSDRPAAILRRPAAAKAFTVAALAAGFRRAASRAGFATNRGFSGFSAFAPGDDPAALFEAAFRDLGSRPVVMCHPGHPDEELRRLDPVVETRAGELAYLASPRFAALLAREGVVLTPNLAQGFPQDPDAPPVAAP